MTHTSPIHSVGRRGLRAQHAALFFAATLPLLAACKDNNIPFYTAPTSVSASPAGVQNAVTGLLGAFRIDMGTFVITVSAGYARDGAVFTNTEPRTVTYPLGVAATPNTSGGVWPQEYQNIRQAEEILATIPNVSPAYSNAQAASLTGIVQTFEAYGYMLLAESHDTNGIAILPPGTLTSPPPAICNKDAWAYIVALLDSANTQLVTAGATAPPIALPTGMAGVGVSSGPGKKSGSFASFNRALTVKALLELAYAKARTPTHGPNAPTPATPGHPDAAAVARALALLDSTAMFDASGALLAPTSAGGFTASASTVTHDFSGASGDVVNPIQGQIGTEAQLNDFVANVDTAHDLRFKAKFIVNPNPVQQQFYNPVANETVGGKTFSWLYYMSPSPGSTIPIIRSEGLTLMAAQIHLATGDLAGAVALANQVRTTVGGLAAGTPTLDYVHVRDFIMKEQRISMTWEASADRTIAIRMYGLAATADTTWLHEDPNVTTGDEHTTVNPIPSGELNGRGGSFTTTCN